MFEHNDKVLAVDKEEKVRKNKEQCKQLINVVCVYRPSEAG